MEILSDVCIRLFKNNLPSSSEIETHLFQISNSNFVAANYTGTNFVKVCVIIYVKEFFIFFNSLKSVGLYSGEVK